MGRTSRAAFRTERSGPGPKADDPSGRALSRYTTHGYSEVEKSPNERNAGDRHKPAEEAALAHKCLYYMSLMREMEDRIERKLYRQGKILGGVYVGRGQEAISTGAALQAEAGGRPFSEPSRYGGVPDPGHFAEPYSGAVYGPHGWSHAGRDANMHMGDLSLNLVAIISALAATVPVAAGAALALKYRGGNNVAMCWFGEGSTSLGHWHEGMNFGVRAKVARGLDLQQRERCIQIRQERSMTAASGTAPSSGFPPQHAKNGRAGDSAETGGKAPPLPSPPSGPSGSSRARFRLFPVRRLDLAIALLVTVAGLTLFAFVGIDRHSGAGFSFVRNIELRSLDARFALRGSRPHDSRIVIVDIDEKTLQRVGSFPIARSAYASLIDRLSAGGARVISFDVAFPTPEKNSAVTALKQLNTELAPVASPAITGRIQEMALASDNDARLAASMKRANNVLLGHLFLDQERAQAIDQQATEEYYNILWDHPFPQIRKVTGGRRDFDLNRAWVVNGGVVAYGIEANIRPLAEAARSFGFFDQNPDPDGTLRHAIIIIRYRDQDFFPSLAFQTVREFEAIGDESVAGTISENGLEGIEFGSHRLAPAGDGTLLINYSGPYGSYQHYSMADVIDDTAPAQVFKDCIVLVGATAVGIGDIRNTPFPSQGRAYMGVEIQANIIDNLLHSNEKGRSFLSRGLREEIVDLVFILFFGLVLGRLFAKTKPLYAAVSALVALIAFGGLVLAAFTYAGLWLSFVVPAGTLIVNYAGITSYRVIFEEQEKRRIRRVFGSYLYPAVIRMIEKDPERYFHPGGESKDLTIMFSDIRSFTSISEGMTADQLIALLNEYLSAMTDVLMRHWGTLDKYIGDAIMAFWGSPVPQADQASRACACALDMMVRLQELNRKWEIEGRRQLKIGIGINSGPVSVGNIGSSKRLAWTVIGDDVLNLDFPASRA